MLLAPVVRERKGEHTQVFEQLRAQGFVRVRVDGELYEIDAVPTLTLRQKHTIEAVIDRFRPREDIKQRLAESFETALKLGNGMASVQTLDTTTTTPHLFSSKYSCPVCDYSLPELEPRLFSFNAPMGRALRATVWESPSFSTRPRSSYIQIFHCQLVLCVVGTAATLTIFN